MTLYIIAIGGTGARCVESIVHLSSTGIFGKSPIKILFVDPDGSNGNLSRARETIEHYRKCREILGEKQNEFELMKTELTDLGIWSPFGVSSNGDVSQNKLDEIFEYNIACQNNPPLAHLMNVLYTQRERELKLNDFGFRGKPAIGAAVLSKLGQEMWNQNPWNKLISDLELNQNNDPRIFLVGSIFGGTGASGFPSLRRLIEQKLGEKQDSVKIGGLLMLPYFQFSKPDNSSDIYAHSDEFLLNTKAALRYYSTQQDEAKSICQSDVTYLLGSPDLLTITNSSLGKNSQRNPSHFIELYAALAARHFLQNTPTQPVVLISRASSNQLTWDDIPDSPTVKPALAQATRFAYAWKTGINSCLKQAQEKGSNQILKSVSWFHKFFKCEGVAGLHQFGKGKFPDLQNEQESIKIINQWCDTYLKWLAAIQKSDNDIQLFSTQAIKELDQERFSELVIEPRTKEKRQSDTIHRLMEQIEKNPANSVGAVGLARSLYTHCHHN